MARAHNVELKYVRMEFVQGKVKRWGEDPLAMGGVPYAGPKQVRNGDQEDSLWRAFI